MCWIQTRSQEYEYTAEGVVIEFDQHEQWKQLSLAATDFDKVLRAHFPKKRGTTGRSKVKWYSSLEASCY